MIIFNVYIGQSIHYLLEYHGSTDCLAENGEKHLHNTDKTHSDCLIFNFKLRSNLPEKTELLNRVYYSIFINAFHDHHSFYKKILKGSDSERAPPHRL